MEYEIDTELLAPGAELSAHRDDIWSILELTDKEFVPPLSSRTPITLGDMQPAKVQFALPIEHLDFLMKMHIIIAHGNGKVVGFLSFQPNFHHETITQFDSTVYIDMVAVKPSWRRRGVARALYEALFNAELFQQHSDAVLHTWSTNDSHSELIESIGFEVIDRIVDERAPGIDTVIYHRTTAPNPFK